MIFIFDWGHKTEKQIGPIAKEDTGFNFSDEFVYLTVVKIWFRMFFIPTIPTKIHYLLVSSQGAVEITRSQFTRFKPLAELNKRVINDDISEQEYEKMRKSLNFD